MAYIKVNRLETSITFARAGIELKIDSTTIFRPSFLEITLRGLRALIALNAFRDLRAVVEVSAIKKSISAVHTTNKSRMFHPTPRYDFYFSKLVNTNPKAIILMRASTMKIKVKTESM